MTSSLAASIFGTIPDSSDAADHNHHLNLFQTSAALPPTPNHLNFIESKREREKRERKEEKKRKRTHSDNKKEQGGVNQVKESGSKEGKNVEDDVDVSDGKEEEDDDDDLDRTIFVGNLPLDIKNTTLASMFKSCGKVKSARIRSVGTVGVKVAPEHAGNQNLVKKIAVNTGKLLENNPKKTSQGYVVFEDKASVDIALKMNNTVHEKSDGLILRVDRRTPTTDSTRSVFIGNLKYEADEMSLRRHFEKGCGFEPDVIENVRIVRNPETMQCRGFGYILFKDKSYIPYALEMHETEFMKKPLRVLVCGKRFKGKRGLQENNKSPTKRGMGVHPAEQRLMKKAKASSAEDILGSKDKLKKKRGVKKSDGKQATRSGISKRSAASKKIDKRVKKIEKRISKGMGKTKK